MEILEKICDLINQAESYVEIHNKALEDRSIEDVSPFPAFQFDMEDCKASTVWLDSVYDLDTENPGPVFHVLPCGSYGALDYVKEALMQAVRRNENR